MGPVHQPAGHLIVGVDAVPMTGFRRADCCREPSIDELVQHYWKRGGRPGNAARLSSSVPNWPAGPAAVPGAPPSVPGATP